MLFKIIDLPYILLRIRLRLFAPSVHFIGTAQTLPPPLGKKEEAEVLARLRAGDENARQELIVHNLRLVVYIAKRFDNAQVDMEDLISIGTIGLIKAVQTFCPDRGIKLATYASRCIENEILMVLRKNAASRTEVSIDEPLNIDWDGNELLLSDVLGSDPDVVHRAIEEEDEKNCLLRTINALDDRERLIMVMRFGVGGTREHTQKEIASLLGISQSYISRLEKRIIRTLREQLQSSL